MRHIGPYQAAETPSLDELVSLFSGEDRVLLDGWLPQFTAACLSFDENIPGVHNMPFVVTDATIRNKLAKTWKTKPKAARERLQRMVLSLPAHDQSLCAFCNLSEDPELDHYLPKSAHPEFAFHARNLVPICGVCNKKKGTIIKSIAGGRVIISPMWDLQNATRMIVAELQFGNTISAKYTLSNDQGLHPDIFSVATRHFKRLGLAGRYARRANAQLSTIVTGLRGKSEPVARSALFQWAQPPQFPITSNGWDVALKAEILTEFEGIIGWLIDKGYFAP